MDNIHKVSIAWLGIECDSGLYATKFSFNKSDGWMYHFTNDAPRKVEMVQLVVNLADHSTGWLRFVNKKPTPSGKDYEVGIPTSLLNPGTKDVKVTIAFGNAAPQGYPHLTMTDAICSVAK